MQATRALFFTGPHSILPAQHTVEADINQPDADLFEQVLHEMAVQWSSTCGQPHFKKAMQRNGRVARFPGRVVVSGAGWSVTFEHDDAHHDKVKQLITNGQGVEAAKLDALQSIWKYAA